MITCFYVCDFNTFNNVVCQFDSTRHSKYMKVVELVVMKIMGFVKNERTFNNLTFTKIRLHNMLCENFELLVCLYVQPIYIAETFIYEKKTSY